VSAGDRVSDKAAAFAVVFVVAVAENGVIGREGALPWKLKSDMARFKALTLHKPVLMGRKTWATLAKPLVHRTNIVITRDRDFAARGAIVVASIEAAFEVARGDALRRGVNEIAVIGGAQIYEQTLPYATRIELTRVHEATPGDAMFSMPDRTQWREAGREDHPKGPGDDAAYTYLTYERLT
jgi:dihydrofolate reductase